MYSAASTVKQVLDTTTWARQVVIGDGEAGRLAKKRGGLSAPGDWR